MASKKRREPVTLFAAARQLAETTLRDSRDTTDQADRLSVGLAALWPAPLTAVRLSGADGEALAVRDEAVHVRRDWHEVLRPLLADWSVASDSSPSAAAPPALGLPDHLMHGGGIAWGGRCYGAVALALHKRTADAGLAQVLLRHLADHLGFGLFQREADGQARGRYRDLADLTNLVGHEFNNVLNSVGLQVAAVVQKGLAPDHFPELTAVRRDITTAGNMVRRLQDLCQKGAPPRQSADLNRAVRVALTATPGLVPRVTFEPQAALPPVQGAALDLERLAGSLLRGAGTGALTVRTARAAGGVVRLQVGAAGADRDDDELRHLFEPFAANRPGEDGVSLALARAIARRLGGSVRGERRAGGGLLLVAELRPAEEGSA
jgi:signal transduction histidine kinase